MEPYLSRPQVYIHAPGLLENVSYVSDLLQLSERKDDSASFRNMSEQLLSAEREAGSTTSLPASHSVSHCLKETSIRTEGLRILRLSNSTGTTFKTTTGAWTFEDP